MLPWRWEKDMFYHTADAKANYYDFLLCARQALVEALQGNETVTVYQIRETEFGQLHEKVLTIIWEEKHA